METCAGHLQPVVWIGKDYVSVPGRLESAPHPPVAMGQANLPCSGPDRRQIRETQGLLKEDCCLGKYPSTAHGCDPSLFSSDDLREPILEGWVATSEICTVVRGWL